MVSEGLAALGYTYLNVDDCWSAGRDAAGRLVPDPKAFPQGMKPLVDYVHSKGLRFGIYADRGDATCAGYEGSLGHEAVDAQTWADWGVDYLKEDSCFASTDHATAFAQYDSMRRALNATGRPIFLSLCGWNAWYAPRGAGLGNSWRIAGDADDWPHIYAAARTNEALARWAGPGGFNDPDMLVGSNTAAAAHITPAQQRTQFSLWAVMAAPLLIGAPITSMTPHDLATYSNRRVIAVNQDRLGLQGEVVFSNCPA